MENTKYRNILGTIRKHTGLTRDCLAKLKTEYPEVNHDTLYSILFNEYQRRMRAKHSKTEHTMNKYWGLFMEGLQNKEPPGIILRISEKRDLCPCLVAKLVLQKYAEETGHIETSKLNVYMRDSSLIPDKDLAYEIFMCTLYDNLYSPLSETWKQSLGQQYEIRLYNEVVKLGLAFRDEDDLRKFGYDKTPDIKLDIPVAIDGFIVNWIESKALFGDEESHRDYSKHQYLSYWNRFGTGLVIYWFGFPKSVQDSNERRFIIRDHLPSDNLVQISSATTTVET